MVRWYNHTPRLRLDESTKQMSYVPGFEYDLFISYASEDNLDGWIERFQKQLTNEVMGLLGRPFSTKTVFFDRIRLKVRKGYPSDLDKAASSSALLLVLLSPNYVTSDWCMRERRVFETHLAADDTFADRAFVVYLRPVPHVPEVLSRTQRKVFYETGAEEPLGAGSEKWLKLCLHLAIEIRSVLKRLRTRTGSVFLGEALDKHMDLRPNLAGYLSKQSFRSIPDPALLYDRLVRREALSQAACAVHFLGGATDGSLEAVEDSIRYCSGPTIIFQPYPAKLSAAEELFIKSLPEDPYPYIAGPNLTELKVFISDLLTAKRREAQPISASLGLICEPADFIWAEHFRADGLTTRYPRFMQDQLTTTEELRQWRQIVQDSHGLIFYHGNSSEEQLEIIRRLADEQGSRAIRRWYLDAPELEQKRLRRRGDWIYPEGLAEFLTEVRHLAESRT